MGSIIMIFLLIFIVAILFEMVKLGIKEKNKTVSQPTAKAKNNNIVLKTTIGLIIAAWIIRSLNTGKNQQPVNNIPQTQQVIVQEEPVDTMAKMAKKIDDAQQENIKKIFANVPKMEKAQAKAVKELMRKMQHKAKPYAEINGKPIELNDDDKPIINNQ